MEKKRVTYNDLPYHNGANRWISPCRGPLPFSPPYVRLSSTFEVISSKEFIPHSCIHRTDYLEWHNHYTYPPYAYCGEEYYDYGGCIVCVTVMGRERTTLDMVVREPAVTSRHDGNIPHRIYKVPIPINPGVNHIMWCLAMRMKLLDTFVLDEMINDQYSIYHHYANKRPTPTIFFPSLNTPSSTSYRLHPDGSYKQVNIRTMGIPGADACAQYSYTPKFTLVLDQTGVLRDVKPTPKNVEVLTTPKNPVSLWGQAWAAAGPKGHKDFGEIEGQIHSYLQPSYIHLRYKPLKYEGNIYKYQFRGNPVMVRNLPIKPMKGVEVRTIEKQEEGPASKKAKFDF